ncbi:DUF308 domain-containing protein [Planctomonas psychrotolerans]|uniref:DUF308 domain-containing protein n=1 Tax=Planctomonas psychrotolerans TaxID=2528712 RepID=UPI001D0CF0DF|nr:DUF308 domain-containing protein [Planctomonas psychrotolerans]
MSVDHVALGMSYWRVPLARAIPALALAAVTTFSTGHSADFGLLTFGVFAVITGAATGVLARASMPTGRPRTVLLGQAAITLGVGVVALLASSAGLLFYLYLVSVWAVVTGFLELYAGLSTRRRLTAARDWIVSGALTALVGIVFLVLPPDYAQTFRADGGIDGVVTASVFGVGLLGVYGAILGVFLMIAALSLKWETVKPVPARGEN